VDRVAERLPMPRRGEVWDIDFDPVVGHEQGGRRPGLVVSVDSFNAGPSQLVFAIPITRTQRPVRAHVPVVPPEGGLSAPSVILCDALRSLARQRLRRRRGQVEPATLAAVEYRLRILLKLP
jgi:mRNA interferase MazF